MSFLTTSFQLPFSLMGRLALGEEEIRMPATFEEYLKFAEECEYKVEYSNKHIISMGSPTDAHELIIMNIGWAMNNIIHHLDDFRVYGSNLSLYIQSTGAHYKPDATVLNVAPEYIKHRVGNKTLKSILNPFAVVEVSSKGTVTYDQTEKLSNYKQCPSLQYIIYIDQHKPLVTVHTRNFSGEDDWMKNEYSGREASFVFENGEISLENIYRKVIFMGAK